MADEKFSERISKLETEMTELKKKIKQHTEMIRKLENHVMHPPLVQKLLAEIKERKVVTVEGLRKHFPKLYGGNLKELYQAVRQSSDFRIVQGWARWSPTYIAYFGEGPVPEDPILMAIDYFQRIPSIRITTAPDSMGRMRKTEKGKPGSMEEIMKTYNVDKDKAYQVWQEILRLFGARIRANQTGKTFRRRF